MSNNPTPTDRVEMEWPDPEGKGYHKKKAVAPSRLVVVEMMYHQLAGEQPTGAESRFSRNLSTDEQSYSRIFKVTSEWAPLPTGWITEGGHGVAMLSLRNEERATGQFTDKALMQLGMFVKVQPDTPNRDMHSPPLLPPIITLIAKVLPGESLRYQPYDIGSLRVRCLRSEPVKCILRLYQE